MKFKNIFKKYKAIIITFTFFIMAGSLCLFLDYFNIPYKMGININFLNLDFWSIFLGNGIVLALFITTFILFDKRNLEKDKLATYAGMVILLETYRHCESFLEIYKGCFLENDEKNIEVTRKQAEYMKTQPFKLDDKIFDCLENGQISRERYEIYADIKGQYETMIMLSLEMDGCENLSKKYYDNIANGIKEEILIIKENIK